MKQMSPGVRWRFGRMSTGDRNCDRRSAARRMHLRTRTIPALRCEGGATGAVWGGDFSGSVPAFQRAASPRQVHFALVWWHSRSLGDLPLVLSDHITGRLRLLARQRLTDFAAHSDAAACGIASLLVVADGD